MPTRNVGVRRMLSPSGAVARADAAVAVTLAVAAAVIAVVTATATAQQDGFSDVAGGVHKPVEYELRHATIPARDQAS